MTAKSNRRASGKPNDILKDIYERLFKAFGPQHWWPGETPFEVAVGAILTQNTNWQNVERAIENLKRHHALTPSKIKELSHEGLASLIRPSGYYNVKAVRLRAFVDHLIGRHRGSMKIMAKAGADGLRHELLGIKGIGEETADSILLYALYKPVFVIDAYTKRILSRHGVLDYDKSYAEFQSMFHERFGVSSSNVTFFNEYHALFVKLGKDYCRPREPKCGDCPIGGMGRRSEQ